MYWRFFYWASVLTMTLTVNGLCARALAVGGVPYSESLITRGLSCLLLVVPFAHWKGLSLIPRSLKTQFFRALLAGLALTLFVMSYNWLTASAVAVLSNIDVPLLIVLGPLVGITAHRGIRILSFLSISFLVWFVVSLEAQVDLTYGLSALGLGVLLLCFGYLFIKKTMSEENEAITMLTPSLAILFYGGAQYLLGHAPATVWSPYLGGMAFLSGATMFGAYYATMRLYAVTDLASAEFPTLIASLVIQPLEAIFLDSPMQATYLLSSGGFVLTTFFILRLHYRTPEVAHG
jgi:drug/metabolite transporter (DMT)-like permease